jgi:transcriptional regulator with XRE-family HTH domain
MTVNYNQEYKLLSPIMEGKVKLDLIEQHVIDFVRKLRADKKLRQEDIAYIIGVKASFIGNVENLSNPAKYNLKHINVFADHFGLSPKDFLPPVALMNGTRKKEEGK